MAVNPAGATTAGRMLLPMLRVMQTAGYCPNHHRYNDRQQPFD
jgi:hypothetical protein